MELYRLIESSKHIPTLLGSYEIAFHGSRLQMDLDLKNIFRATTNALVGPKFVTKLYHRYNKLDFLGQIEFGATAARPNIPVLKGILG